MTISPSDTEGRPVTGDFMTYFILLSKQKGVKCQFTSPTAGIIEGDKETLLEVLNEIDNTSFSTVVKKVAITV